MKLFNLSYAGNSKFKYYSMEIFFELKIQIFVARNDYVTNT